MIELLVYVILSVLTASLLLAVESKNYGRRNALEAAPIYVLLGFFWPIVLPLLALYKLVLFLARLLEERLL